MKTIIMKRLSILVVGLTFGILYSWAQPKARAAQQAKEKSNSEMSVRAMTQFPQSQLVPQNPTWMREIYRTIDLTKGNNGVLYYPVEPIGKRTNLFSLLFKLVGSKKISAYEYLLDGTERFTEDNKMDFKDLLDRFQIYYEEKRIKGRKDPALVIENSDIPSADVLSYFVKEVWYFDQRSSTYGSAITAICPVMHRTDEFSSEPMKLPMFWVDYNELQPYLNDIMIMSSNLNNAMNRSMADFFISKQYTGEIYKTTNMQNQPLAAYCKTDSALVKEQQRIEKELADFEKLLYGTDAVKKEKSVEETGEAKVKISDKKSDSTSMEKVKEDDKQKTKSNSKKKWKSKSGSSSASTKKKISSSSSAPKASVRRERR